MAKKKKRKEKTESCQKGEGEQQSSAESGWLNQSIRGEEKEARERSKADAAPEQNKCGATEFRSHISSDCLLPSNEPASCIMHLTWKNHIIWTEAMSKFVPELFKSNSNAWMEEPTYFLLLPAVRNHLMFSTLWWNHMEPAFYTFWMCPASTLRVLTGIILLRSELIALNLNIRRLLMLHDSHCVYLLWMDL